MSIVSKNRRNFIRNLSGIAVLGATAPLFTTKAYANILSGHGKALKFYNRHTQERVQGVFWQNGQYNKQVLASFDHHLRDHRQQEVAALDPKLFDFIHAICEQLGIDKEIHIISGYRSPKTNAMLASKSTGVAKKSYHMRGMAIDFAIPGVDLALLRDTAKALRLGGVGYYPESGFIHLDTGRVRSW
ncbi:DUF882 domain-containing protein [Thalassotalea mangrovi]|uniref:Murein endopeptidase K n=1 Tax=Thalassotalea mangrovi TaxID=2572245 RepID=A0A4U1B4M7_9GAMM|nr:DUF882 domain-containing protein [Thalassotalea mangrovi]TKB45116.1 DUF882 domain-containing protein [Thalassotalea mangrovi]